MDLIHSFASNGALLAVLAHGMIGVSLVWDKVLLKNRGTKNLYSYVFWLGSLSVLGVALPGRLDVPERAVQAKTQRRLQKSRCRTTSGAHPP